MFDLDNWNEIFSTIKKNKMRTFLTGFSISWGIFMFCILLSAGNGLRNGMVQNFGSRAVNSVQYTARTTSMTHQGLPANRRIHLNNNDIEFVRTQIPEADIISPRIATNLAVNYGVRNTNSLFVGISPDFQHIGGITIRQGRYINGIDIRDRRKVAVINERMAEVLFPNQDPLGRIMIAGGLGYTVVGIFEEQTWGQQEVAHIPYTTAQMLYMGRHRGWGLGNVVFTVNDLNTREENEAFNRTLRERLAVLHHFDPTDIRPIGIWNMLDDYLQFLGIFNAISAFIWIIGIGTLIAGITGVSNIMLITVRERTREIGIRKALGAKPSNVLGSILMESVFITAIFGYIGMFMGVGLGELVNTALENMGGDGQMPIANPTIDVSVAIGAMLVLIVSGVIAGYFPARKAVKISPIEAMRAE